MIVKLLVYIGYLKAIYAPTGISEVVSGNTKKGQPGMQVLNTTKFKKKINNMTIQFFN